MKILQLITLGDLFYGAQKHVMELSESLIQEGHEVLIVVGSIGDFTRILDNRKLPYKHLPEMVHPVSPVQDVKAIYALIKLIRKFRPDIVATHSAKAGIVGRIAAWLTRTPSTFTAHGWAFADGIPERQKNMALIAERLCGKIANRIIAVAEIEREFGLQHKVGNAEKVVTIHYGINDISNGEPHRSLEEEQAIETPMLTMVAGFREQKDHPTLIRALATLTDLPWTLTLLGHGPLLPNVQALVRELKLESRVHFMGAVEDVPAYLRDTTILVLATNWEGLPISTIEGLSLGLPVVATDVAGTREQVVDEYNGITVPRADVDALANALRKLIQDPDRRHQYGQNSRALYEKYFTLAQMVGRTEKLYQEVLSQK